MNPIQMDLRDFLRTLGRSWILIVGCTLLGLGCAIAYLATQPVLYSATSSSYISISSATDSSTLSQGTSFAQQAATDYAVIAGSPYVLNRVRSQLNLQTSGFDLTKQVSAEAVANSAVIEITATADSPSLAAALANATAVQLAQAVQRLNPNIGNAASIARATQIQVAASPSAPIQPRVGLDLAAGLVGGVGLGFVIVLARELFNTRIRSVRQLERAMESTVHGVVRLEPDNPASRSESSLAIFRAVRTDLLAGAVRNRLVVVASATPGQSSAVIAADIATSVARLGLRTLLLDAAERSGSAQRLFGQRSNAGLWDLLSHRASVTQALVRTTTENLSYLPPGSATHAPEDLAASLEFVDVLETLSSQFDVIVANADPVGDTTTTRSLTQSMDGIVLVAELDKTTITEVRQSSISVERAGGRIIGTILVDSGLERAVSERPGRHGPLRSAISNEDHEIVRS